MEASTLSLVDPAPLVDPGEKAKEDTERHMVLANKVGHLLNESDP